MILLFLSCQTSEVDRPEPPLSAGPTKSSQTVVLAVPNDCPHLIVDVVTDHESNIVLSCFDGVTRTYFSDQRAPALVKQNEPTADGRLVIEYVPMDFIARQASLTR